MPTLSIGGPGLSVVVADLDGDARDDVAAVAYFKGTRVSLSRRDGTFSAPIAHGRPNNLIDAADLDQDGDLDLFGISYWGDSLDVLENRGDGSFAPSRKHTTASFPVGLAAGDFDADGWVDLVVGSQDDHQLAFFYNQGDGELGPAQYRPELGSSADEIRAADMNQDGLADLLLADRGSQTVRLLLTDGSGGVRPVIVDLERALSSVRAADLNEDGLNDIVASTQEPPGYVVALGRGDGSFGPRQYREGAGATGAAPLDLDADGHVDLIGVLRVAGEVVIHRGRGDGTFEDPISYAAGVEPLAASTGDVNGDGYSDIVVANFYPEHLATEASALTVLLGNGDATFRSYRTYETGAEPVALATADLDADGLMDLVSANHGDGSLTVLYGTGEDSRANSLSVPVNGQLVALAIGDLNADAQPELVVASEGEDSVTVLAGIPGGGYQTALAYALDASPLAVALGDLNQDGAPDLALLLDTDSSGTLLPLLGQPDGSYLAGGGLTTGPRPRSLVLADLDGDDDEDVVVVNENYDGELTLLTNTGSASFVTSSVGFTTPETAKLSAAAVADLNRDLQADIVALSGRLGSPSRVTVLLQKLDGSYAEPVHFEVGGEATSLTLADFDGDGYLDIATSSPRTGTVSVALGNGDGSFHLSGLYASGGHPSSLVSADFDADGRVDLGLSNSVGKNVTLLLNEGLVCGYD